jgi:hypothetical protein
MLNTRISPYEGSPCLNRNWPTANSPNRCATLTPLVMRLESQVDREAVISHMLRAI